MREFHDYDLAELREYIDWQPFFNAWEMKGRFPDILNNPATGEAARKLYNDAQEMLDTLIREKWLTANGVIGFFPANAVGDDIEVYTDETRAEVLTTLHNLRQQGEHRAGIPNRSLGDFIAPKDTGLADYVGAFAVTAGWAARPRSWSSRRRSTTTARFCWSRSPTGWPRRLPSGCTSGSARSSGDTSPTSNWTTRRSSVRGTSASARPGLPGLPGAHREDDAVRVDGRDQADRHRADRVDGDVARCRRQRLVFLAPAVAVLRGRPDGPGPGRRLRQAQGLDPAGGRALAGPNLGYNPED
ncbi:methionine synthase domain protein [Mycobacterium ulcerans str. Harvey]|uniref:Methionine synthase domain protein n=1 Tax=Mycobacterium ulcerans str. Harvey TaxID=1299332 RepID=A0ABN0R6E1_MYCUL|nr:methionine synthase domain protein [Mycobacterium ulcerans str. Harvey]